MSKIYCPNSKECPAEQGYWKLKTTFAAHWAEGHMKDLAEVDFCIGRLLKNKFNGKPDCPFCGVENKLRNRRKLLAHLYHKHCNGRDCPERELDIFIDNYIPLAKEEEAFSTAEEVRAAAENFTEKVNKKTEGTAAVKWWKDDHEFAKVLGYESDKSNTSKRSASAAEPFDERAAASKVLKNPAIRATLYKKYKTFMDDHAPLGLDLSYLQNPDEYFEENAKKGAGDYNIYLKEHKKALQEALVDLDEDGEIAEKSGGDPMTDMIMLYKKFVTKFEHVDTSKIQPPAVYFKKNPGHGEEHYVHYLNSCDERLANSYSVFEEPHPDEGTNKHYVDDELPVERHLVKLPERVNIVKHNKNG
jgi:hypothetical protein